jgi:hypothetical protein
MITLVGAAPVIGFGSLDGFAIGALVSGACALAIITPRRTRRRAAAAGLPVAAIRSNWLGEHVMASETQIREPRPAGEHVALSQRRLTWLRTPGAHRAAGGADDERLARPEEVGAHGADLLADGRGSRALGYRSRHRLGDRVPPSPSPAAPRDRAVPGGTPQDSAAPGASGPDRGPDDGAPPNGARPAFPESAFPGLASRNGEPTDVTFPEGSFGHPGRPEIRRIPRHAAPTVGFAARMTGLLAARALAGDARC